MQLAHGTEVAFALLTQRCRVRIPAAVNSWTVVVTHLVLMQGIFQMQLVAKASAEELQKRLAL